MKNNTHNIHDDLLARSTSGDAAAESHSLCPCHGKIIMYLIDQLTILAMLHLQGVNLKNFAACGKLSEKKFRSNKNAARNSSILSVQCRQKQPKWFSPDCTITLTESVQEVFKNKKCKQPASFF